MRPTATVQVLVEGPRDKRFWDEALHRTWPSMDFDVSQAGCKGSVINGAYDHVTSARNTGACAALIILDQDGDECPPRTAKLVWRRLSNNERRAGLVIVAVVARELEAWMLADERTVRRAYPGCSVPECQDTCELLRPDEEMDRVEESARQVPDEDRWIYFGKKINLDRAACRNASLQRLLQRIEEALR